MMTAITDKRHKYNKMQKKQYILYNMKSMCYNYYMAKLHDQIRKAIIRSKKSRYALSKECGISEGQLSLFMKGRRGIGIDALERLADCLEYEITIKPKQKRKRR